jgi:hypothetical protein
MRVFNLILERPNILQEFISLKSFFRVQAQQEEYYQSISFKLMKSYQLTALGFLA